MSANGEALVKYGCGCLFLGPFLLPLLFGVPAFFGMLFGSSFSILGALGLAPLMMIIGAVLGVVLGLGRNLADRLSATTKRRMKYGGGVLFGFGALALLTAIGLSLRPADFRLVERVPPRGATVGPFTLEKPNTKLHVEVEQSIDRASGSFQRWSFVTVELLDEEKTYLASFGGEFWHEAGYDDGYWREDDEQYTAKLEVPSPGTYYVRLQTESDVSTSELSPVRLELDEYDWWGTPIPLRVAAHFAFLLGAFLVMAPRMKRPVDLTKHLEEGARVAFQGQHWMVQRQAHCEYDDWQSTEWTLHPLDGPIQTPRYIEREYEADSDWENWLWSCSVSLDGLACDDAEAPHAGAYAEQHGALPDAVVYAGERYTLGTSAVALRDGDAFTYHNYEGEDDRFITIEGDPKASLRAVAGGPLDTTDVSVETEEDEAA